MGVPSLNQFQANQTAVAADVNENFATLKNYVDANCILKDASLDFTSVPAGPAADPVDANDLARKQYVDTQINLRTGFQSVGLTTPYTIVAFDTLETVAEASFVIPATWTATNLTLMIWSKFRLSNNNNTTGGAYKLEYTLDALAASPTWTELDGTLLAITTPATEATVISNSAIPYRVSSLVGGKTVKVRLRVQENNAFANKWVVTPDIKILALREVSFA
jgi:hypothetical protein